jgi:hypothetical protein
MSIHVERYTVEDTPWFLIYRGAEDTPLLLLQKKDALRLLQALDQVRETKTYDIIPHLDLVISNLGEPTYGVGERVIFYPQGAFNRPLFVTPLGLLRTRLLNALGAES